MKQKIVDLGDLVIHRIYKKGHGDGPINITNLEVTYNGSRIENKIQRMEIIIDANKGFIEVKMKYLPIIERIKKVLSSINKK